MINEDYINMQVNLVNVRLSSQERELSNTIIRTQTLSNNALMDLNDDNILELLSHFTKLTQCYTHLKDLKKEREIYIKLQIGVTDETE